MWSSWTLNPNSLKSFERSFLFASKYWFDFYSINYLNTYLSLLHCIIQSICVKNLNSKTKKKKTSCQIITIRRKKQFPSGYTSQQPSVLRPHQLRIKSSPGRGGTTSESEVHTTQLPPPAPPIPCELGSLHLTGWGTASPCEVRASQAPHSSQGEASPPPVKYLGLGTWVPCDL